MSGEAKKILIVSANPKDTGRLRLDAEIRDIKEGLSMAPHRGSFQIECVPAARQIDIRRYMLSFSPNIVHFCGHGSETEGLVFEDTEGVPRVASTQSLADFFKLFRESTECVVLNACYSKSQAEVISKHIKYVVGMNASIKDDTAVKFSVAFYDSVFAGKPYEFAFDVAKNALQWCGDEEGVPILLSCTASSVGGGSILKDQIPDWKSRIISTFSGRRKVGFISEHVLDSEALIVVEKFVSEKFLVVPIKSSSAFEYAQFVEENAGKVDCLLYLASGTQASAWRDFVESIAKEHDIPALCIHEIDILSPLIGNSGGKT